MCLGLLPVLGFAQEGSLTVGNGAWGGLIVRFSARVEPARNGSAQLHGGVMPTQDGTHRIIDDMIHKRRFGYDLHGVLLGDGQTLQITLGPLTSGGSGRPPFQLEPGWTMIAPPKFPVVAAMRAGEAAAIDLLVNPATGQNLVEYLSVERADLDPKRIPTIAPRDFGLDDVELFLDRPRVWVNGNLVPATADSRGGIRAHTLWLYLPGDGTFVFSLWPESGLGFQRVGMLQGKTLTFHNGASEYRVECASAIAPGSGVYNVYLYYDSTPPKRGIGEFLIGGADKGASLVRK
jgi:hypothetical protein